jgi:hypothetical protein
MTQSGLAFPVRTAPLRARPRRPDLASPETDHPFTEEEALALRRAADELVESQARIVWLGAESERLWTHRKACERKRDELLEPFRKAEQQRSTRSWNRYNAVKALITCGAIAYACLFLWKAPMTGFLRTPATALVLLGGTACWCYTPWIRSRIHARRGAAG